jgi:pSer/pThr/pTyr-binding forkhead associated (FHA) protein
VLVDLGSTNGTRINGAPITERRLEDGDTIAVGDATLRYEAG